MDVDGEGPSKAESASDQRPSRLRKVCVRFYSFERFPNDCFLFIKETPRPEVRLLKYNEVPGLEYGRTYFKAQKYIKRSKTEHPGPSSSEFLYYSFLIIAC